MWERWRDDGLNEGMRESIVVTVWVQCTVVGVGSPPAAGPREKKGGQGLGDFGEILEEKNGS